MAISHLCLSCGWDLARVRAQVEPRYALAILLCPRCGEAAVRQIHPAQRGWRTFLRLKTSLLALIFQLAALVAGLSVVILVCVQVGDAWVRGALAAPKDDELIVAFLAFALLPILLGAWLTAGFSHTRRLGTWLVFSILALGALSVDCVAWQALQRLLDACGLSMTLADYRWDLLGARLAVLATLMIIATAGIPLGMLALAAHRRWRRNRWRARRRRFRARRTGR
jgi:hypothetical protein